MNILSLQAAYHPMVGGAELFHKETAERLVRKGHSVDVVTCVWKKPDIPWNTFSEKYEEINHVGVYRCMPWSYRHLFQSFGAILPMYNLALQLIKKKKYDIVHSHIFPASVVGGLLKRKFPTIPLITTVQGGDIADYDETGKVVSFALKPAIAWSLKRADVVHAVSQDLGEKVKAMGVKNIQIIPNGVDTTVFKPRDKKALRTALKLPQNVKIIVSHSRLTPKNGLDLLIRSVAELKKEQILLLLIGGGEQENELKTLSGELGVDDKVKFMGYLPVEKTAEYVAASDLFVRPSREEGFGISFIEAQASGIPVIGTAVGGIKDIIKHRETGILVAPEDIEELKEACESLMENPLLYDGLVKRGVELAAKYYSWELITQKLERLYETTTIKHKK